MTLSNAQLKALDKFTQPGGRGYGEYSGIRRDTVKKLWEMGLVDTRIQKSTSGKSMDWAEITPKGKEVLGKP